MPNHPCQKALLLGRALPTGHTAEIQRGLVAQALDGATGAAIFSTGPSRWEALLRDEPGNKYGNFPSKINAEIAVDTDAGC